MKRAIRCSVLILAAFAAAQAAKANQPGPSCEHLKGLEFLIGTWEATADDGSATVSVKYEWVLNGRVLAGDVRISSGGEVLPLSLIYAVWDASEQQVHGVRFMANGGLAEAKWEQGDSSWRVIGTEIDVDGSREPFEAHLTPVDPSQLIFRNAAGEVVFRRSDRFPPLGPGPLEPGPNYRHLQHLGKTTGKLVCAGTRADGKQITGTAFNRWVLNQNFMLCTEQGAVEGEDPVDYLIMVGWHPAENKCAMWGAASDGSLFRRLGDYDAGERVWTAEQRIVTADAKTGSGTAKEHYPEEGGLTLELTGLHANGEPIPDVKAEYRNATPTPAAERLKDWEYFIGDWEVDGVWQLPHEEPQHVRYELSAAWTLDKNFIENRTVNISDGERQLVHRALVGIDPQTDQITAWGFWARFGGYQETVVWSRQDDKTWIVTRENLRGVRTILDADTFKYEAQFRMDDGSPGKWQTTARRKK